MAPVSFSDIEKAVSLCVSGKTVREISAVLGVSCSTVSRLLRSKGGVPKRHAGRKPKFDKNKLGELFERYTSGTSYELLAGSYGVSTGCIRGTLASFKIPPRYPVDVPWIDTKERPWLFEDWYCERMADYLDKKGVDWYYQHTTFGLSDGSKYAPAFLILSQGKADHFIEVAGWINTDRICTWEKFITQYPSISWEIVGPAEMADLGALEPCWGTHPQSQQISKLRKCFTKPNSP
jgi:hypothetical protein